MLNLNDDQGEPASEVTEGKLSCEKDKVIE
jgi:hypothetical protein